MQILSNTDPAGLARAEEKLLSKYKRMFREYGALFEESDAIPVLRLSWENEKSGAAFESRPLPTTGYRAYIECALEGDPEMTFSALAAHEENGKILVDDSVDEEALDVIEDWLDALCGGGE